MPRPPRIQFPGALYHVTAQANRDGVLYVDAGDRQLFMSLLSLTAGHHDWRIHSWCLMTTHYHLLLTTPNGDLSAGMHRLNSRYAHLWNDDHREAGHHFKARYSAKLVDTEEYLHEVYRYIALNPVRAGICRRPEEWRWSSYAYLFGGVIVDLPSNERWLLDHFGPGAEAREKLRDVVEREPTRPVPGTGHVPRGLVPPRPSGGRQPQISQPADMPIAKAAAKRTQPRTSVLRRDPASS